MPETIINRFGGINNAQDPLEVGWNGMDSATNVRVSDGGTRIGRRGGYAIHHAAVGASSVFSDGTMLLYHAGGTLWRHDPVTATSFSLRSGLSSGRITYLAIFGKVYYTNGYEIGVIEGGVNRSLGLEQAAPPTLAAGVGSLRAGTYRVAASFVRRNGMEGGADGTGEITLAVAGGIALSSIPVSLDPDVVAVRLYASTWNGSELYQVAEIPNGTTTYVIDTENGTTNLDNLLKSPPPAGDMLAFHGNRLWVIKGQYAFYSDLFNGEWFSFADGAYLDFGFRITLFAPTNTGIWVGTISETGYVEGLDPTIPEAWRYSTREQATPIAGSDVVKGGVNTEATPDAEALQLQGIAHIWMSDKGWRLGLDGGQLVPLAKNFQPPYSKKANAGLIEQNGEVYAIVTLDGTPTAGNEYPAGDLAKTNVYVL